MAEWLWQRNSSYMLQAQVQSTLTEEYLNAATALVTIRDLATGAPLTGGDTWPVTLAYVAASQGLYRATLAHATALRDGQRLIATVTIVNGLLQWEKTFPITVTD